MILPTDTVAWPRPEDKRPEPGDTVTAFDRLILGPSWCEALSAARVDVYGRPIGGQQ